VIGLAEAAKVALPHVVAHVLPVAGAPIEVAIVELVIDGQGIPEIDGACADVPAGESPAAAAATEEREHLVPRLPFSMDALPAMSCAAAEAP